MFTINSNGELNVNGKFTKTHFGEHRLTIDASDYGNPPNKNQIYIIVNIQENDSQELINNFDVSKSFNNSNNNKNIQFFGSSLNSKSLSSENNQLNSVSASALFSRATLPNLYSSS